MKAILYDLAGRDGLHFSAFCWRARMALAHKGITPEIVPVHFFEIKSLPSPSGEPWKTVPVFEDDDGMVGDSWNIALHLEQRYPDRPSLFGGEGTILGALIGAALLSVLNNGLIHLNVSPFWQILINGLVVIVAIGVNRVLMLRRARD